MGLQENFIFVLPILEQYLLHAPLHGITALVNEAFLVRLKENWVPKESDELASMVKNLSTPPPKPPRVRAGKLDPVFLGIIPTRACNLACNYCAFGALESKPAIMDRNLATEAVAWMADHVKNQGGRDLKIHFFGGEPFFAPELVASVVEKAEKISENDGLVPKFEVSTNGFFNENWCNYIANHMDAVVLSFDGPETIQNLHRPTKHKGGSFQTVSRNSALLGKSAAELNIRICVTQDSVKDLDDMADWFCKNFTPSSLCFEPLQPTDQSNLAGLHPPDPFEFAHMVQKASRICSPYGIDTIYNSATITRLRNTFCPVGRDALIISPDGQVDACYLQREDWEASGMDLHLGNFSPDGKMTLDFDAIERVRKLSAGVAECESCFCRWYCAGGCHVKRHARHHFESRENFCIQTRLLTACNLLDMLGCRELTDVFIKSREAKQKLALQSKDTFRNWCESI